MSGFSDQTSSTRELSELETTENKGEIKFEQMAHSFNSLCPPSAAHQSTDPTVSQPTRASWNDLPEEILVCIARHSIIPQESTATDQYPSLDEIETPFGAINQQTRRAFFDAIRQDSLFIELHFFNRPNPGINKSFAVSFQRYFPSPRSNALFNSALCSGYRPSFLRMRFDETFRFDTVPACSAVFCATPWNITLMRSFLVSQRGLYPNLLSDCHSSRRPAINNIRTIIQDTEKFTRDMSYVGTFTSSSIMSVMETSVLSAQMMQPLDYSAQFLIHEHHLQSIQKAIQYKEIQKILPYVADAAIDHIRCFRRFCVLRHPDPRVTRQRSLYITLVLKSFSAYLWLRPNTHDQQTHCLFAEGSHGDRILRECLVCTNSAKLRLERHGWTPQTNKDLELSLRAVFSMLQARAEYELALARTASLPNAFMISPHVQRNMIHQLGKLDVDDHLQLSEEMRSMLLRIYETRVGLEADMSAELISFQKWNDMMTVLKIEMETADNRTMEEMMTRGILGEPILQEFVKGLRCTWVFSEGD